MSNAPVQATPSDLAVAYGATRARITTLLADGQRHAGTIVPACPDWTVADLCAHLAGVCADLVARRNPSGDTQAWVDGQVADRQGRPVAELLDEWATASPSFERLIEAKPAGFAGLLYDVVAHEHDLRHALRQPGMRDDPAVVMAMDVGVNILERDLATHGLGAVSLRTADKTWTAGAGEAELLIDMRNQPHGTWTLLRLLGSRRSEAQLLAAPWVGPARTFLPALAHMALPPTDVDE
jgi:uncharacterized protein (TIGR03083 family)